MAFKSFSVALATSNTDVIECPATTQGAAVLMAGNVSGGALTYTLKIYRQATGQTVTVISAKSLAANTAEKVPAPISLEAGDKVVMLCSSANNIVVTGTFTYSATVPVATGFDGRGEWDDEATYVANDVVSLNGNSYLALSNEGTNLNQNPETATDFWMLLAEKGDTGDGDLSAANNLSDLSDAATAFANIKQAATETATGVVELATSAEVATGTDTARAVTPAGAAARYLPKSVAVRTVSGTSDTPVLTDAGNLIRTTSGSAVTITIPPNSSVAFPVGTVIYVTQHGSGGTVTLAPGSGVSLLSEGGMLSTADRYVVIGAVQHAADAWTVFGALKA